MVVINNIICNSFLQLIKRLITLLITVEHFRFEDTKEGFHQFIRVEDFFFLLWDGFSVREVFGLVDLIWRVILMGIV